MLRRESAWRASQRPRFSLKFERAKTDFDATHAVAHRSRDDPCAGAQAASRGRGRPASTAILFLLARGERSHWHRIDAVEVWHYYAGAPFKLEVVDGSKEEIFRLGADINAGEAPQVTVPARAWQAAESLGPWTLTGCTVAPEFSFEGFELAPAGWSPHNHSRR
jgi:uncharacterized protein